MASIFTKIIKGELPSYKIMEDEETIAILTLDQVTLGHTLVIPKQEVNHWFETPDSAYLAVHRNAKKIGPALMAATGCSRVLTAAIGFEVPHYHLHLIPAWSMADLDFKKGQRRSDAEMREVLAKIQSHLK